MNTVEHLELAVVLLILMGAAGFAPRTVTSTRSAQAAVALAAVERGGQRAVDEAGGTIDLYGNEVTDAVAQYTLDPAGSLYELHSPRTELPRLGSPRS